MAIEMYDANRDGKLTADELIKCPGLKAAAARLAPDGQGITAEMIAAEIRRGRTLEWRGSRSVASCCTMGSRWEGRK